MSEFRVVILSVGVLTFLTRLSFIYLYEKWQSPEVVTRALRFVPVAALTAIFVPELALQNGELVLSLGNIRLMAGIIAIMVAWRTKSALWTIGVGLISFWLLTWLM